MIKKYIQKTVQQYIENNCIEIIDKQIDLYFARVTNDLMCREEVTKMDDHYVISKGMKFENFIVNYITAALTKRYDSEFKYFRESESFIDEVTARINRKQLK